MIWRVCATLTLLGLNGYAGAADADLVDIAARIDYGYYSGEARVIIGARADLERIRAVDGAVDYYLGYAAYRLSQLDTAASPRARRELLGNCVDSGRAALADSAWALEAWILIAACSVEGLTHDPSRTIGHDLRLADALSAARRLDPKHPRLLLVEAWAQRAADSADDGLQAQLIEARDAFDAWQSTGAQPVWGRAEALASLGALHLELGERREARDLIEQALIEAPGYHFALDLRDRLSLAR